ncbi:hypothetical protein L1887_24333 [Cichorium endivia]|nr:hypothetical protein L1887_24333 [Cichorium endivia]
MLASVDAEDDGNFWEQTVIDAEDDEDVIQNGVPQHWESERHIDIEKTCESEGRDGENLDSENCEKSESAQEVESVPRPKLVQPNALQNGPINLGSPKEKTSSLNNNNEYILGQSLLSLSRSRSLDLNENPRPSTPGVSRTWCPRPKEHPDPTTSSSLSINQKNPKNPEETINSSQELN